MKIEQLPAFHPAGPADDPERCACVHSDARECSRIRYNRPLFDMDEMEEDACECPCHESWIEEDE